MVPEKQYFCAADGWENEAKAKRLPTLLEGEALAVWLELSEAKQKSYKMRKPRYLNEWGLCNLH